MRDVERARTVLKHLFGEIRLYSVEGGLEAELNQDWLGALSLAENDPARLKVLMVAGTGFEPVTFGL